MEEAKKQKPMAVFIIGAGASGKYSIGIELARMLGEDWAFCPNHQAIEVAYSVYPSAENDDLDWGLVGALRDVIEEHLVFKKKSIIYTNVVRKDNVFDKMYFARKVRNLKGSGYDIRVLALAAPLDVRLKRNVDEARLQAKPSKKDVEQSEKILYDEMEQCVLENPNIKDVMNIFGCGEDEVAILDVSDGSVEEKARQAFRLLEDSIS